MISLNNKNLFNLIKNEKKRQRIGIELIASENYPSKTTQEVVWSIFMAKYAEGYPLNSESNWQKGRYYWGCEFVDELENSTRNLALQMFDLNKDEWHVNVQPHSWSNANEATLISILNNWDKILSFDLSHWWHLSHWMKLNTSWRNYEIKHYWVDKETHMLNYLEIEKIAMEYKPKIIIAGASAYPREIDFVQFRKIADKVGAYLMVDMAHIAGLIVAKLHNSPFSANADFVTTTTHKTLRWNRGWLIYCKKEFAKKVDTAVFPWIQWWPLMNEIAWKNETFFEANTPEFKDYQRKVANNSKELASSLKKEFEKFEICKNINILTNWTDNHLFLIDFSKIKLNWKENIVTWLFIQNCLGKYNITVNKNLLPFDMKSPKETSWIRIWTPAITTRWANEKMMKTLAVIIAEIINQEIINYYIHNLDITDINLINKIDEFMNWLTSIWIDWKDFLS